ncbi:Uncharacterised protein [Legionella adelaidensis]|uniref:Uncharacterized protein n=1 Tax=Legionella adelaidensis TaxID=45056 RepID=A0A0W0R6H4_9GAMM|nr:hypothetical protein [Legionella adelaidensis]KTC66636.1 hypothetical protein Lade_1294 [Legionella adelaidensis]VEH81019.1 Uncharacterised protein [Legionella adelaidensis]
MLAVVCLDFDFTIVLGHTHNIICQREQALARSLTEDEQWDLVKDIPPRGGKERWCALFCQMANEFPLAIVSFNAYPAIIPRYLREVIGLPNELVQEIFIDSWLPENPLTANKNQHLANVLHYFQDCSHLILVDDSENNIKGAQEKGYKTIWAELKAEQPDTFPHLRELESEVFDSPSTYRPTQNAFIYLNDFDRLYWRNVTKTQAENFVDSVNLDESGSVIIRPCTLGKNYVVVTAKVSHHECIHLFYNRIGDSFVFINSFSPLRIQILAVDESLIKHACQIIKQQEEVKSTFSLPFFAVKASKQQDEQGINSYSLGC